MVVDYKPHCGLQTVDKMYLTHFDYNAKSRSDPQVDLEVFPKPCEIRKTLFLSNRSLLKESMVVRDNLSKRFVFNDA